MTEPAGDAGPADANGLRIHKVLSRGYAADAQVLLVLVSAPIATPEGGEPDVWVAIGQKEARSIAARVSAGDSVESARRLGDDELQRLDDERSGDARAFDLALEPARAYRLARFDFSDHVWVRDSWNRVVQGQSSDPPTRLDVACWQARPGRKVGKKSSYDTFDPLGEATTESFALGDVVYQPAFDLGVLFVHGIGSHGERETLVQWSEPIVRFWQKGALAIGELKARIGPPDQRAAIQRRVESHALRSRAPIDGIAHTLEQFGQAGTGDFATEAAAQAAAGKGRTSLCCATARPEQTLFPDRNPGSPSASLLRLSRVDRDATLRESHVLFAETAWAREAFPPTVAELYHWLTASIPIAVWARLERLATTRLAEIDEFAAAAAATGTRFDRLRVTISRLLLLLQQVFLPAGYLAVALASQVTIALVGLLGLLPIPWLGRGIRWVTSALMGTLGQSYALQTSPIRRSAIVSAVALDIDWLSDRCRGVVVLSHSQGAEISRLAFLEARRDKIRRWYTFGAGIAPLIMLSPQSLARPSSKRVVLASKVLLALALALVAILVADSVPGVSLGMREVLAQLIGGVGAWGVLVAWLLSSCVLLVLCPGGGPAVETQLRRTVMAKWTDYFASEDPVPGGSLLRRWGAELHQKGISPFTESRIFNLRFMLLDHTTYFRNVEQFVAPIALDLLRYAGLGGRKTTEAAALARASRRRDLRTWWTLAGSSLALALAAAIFFRTAFGGPGRAAAWLAEGSAIVARKSDAWDRLALAWSDGVFGRLAHDLWPCAVPLALMFLGWAVSRWLGGGSVDRLVDELAATMGDDPAPPAAAPSKETP